MSRYIKTAVFIIISFTLIFTGYRKISASESLSDEEVYYNCGCGCRHKTIEECEACPCCKGKDVYKNGKLFKKAEKKDDTTVDNKTEDKIEDKNNKKTQEKQEDIYNCGCGCRHKTIEECEACPCCKGKDIYKNGKLFKKAKTKSTKKAKTEDKPENDIKNTKKSDNIIKKAKTDKKEENTTKKVQEDRKKILNNHIDSDKNKFQSTTSEVSEVTKEEKREKNVSTTTLETPEKPKKIKIYNCGCGCMHKTMDEFNKCPCCKGKEVKITYIDEDVLKDETATEKEKVTDKAYDDLEIKEDEYVNCGCGCKHKTMKEFNECPCCMGKKPQIHKENESKFNYIYIIYFFAGAATMGVVWAVKEELGKQK